MIGLRGARVVVVDDRPDEALPILKAMAKAGIATAFFEGKQEDLPIAEDRLEGVRLAVLDMDLVGGGVPDKSKAATIVGFLEGLLSPGNGPYGVIAWTRHPEIRAHFEEAVFRSGQLPRPIFIETMQKVDYQLKGDGFDLKKIGEQLAKSLAENRPFLFFQIWEEAAILSASSVIATLSSFVESASSDPGQWRSEWRTDLLCLLHAIAKASAEQNLDDKTCIEALCAAFNPLHSDGMESRAFDVAKRASGVEKEVLAASADCGAERRAKVNAMLHVALPRDGSLTAGGIYTAAEAVLQKLGMSVDRLLDDLVKGAKGAADHTEWIGEVKGASKLVLVEVSPACDHAQRNIRSARFIAGILVPAANRGRIKDRADFFRSLGPLFLSGAGVGAGQYELILDARHPVSFDAVAGQDLTAGGLAAIGRIRGQALTVLQDWLANQGTRPGMLFLEPPR